MPKNIKNEHPEDELDDIPYTPSSAVKRTMAWIGIVYMLIVVSLTTYFYFTASMLNNLAPILSIPALVGAGILILVSHKTEGRPSKGIATIGAILCFALAILTVPIGIFGLLSNFGG